RDKEEPKDEEAPGESAKGAFIDALAGAETETTVSPEAVNDEPVEEASAEPKADEAPNEEAAPVRQGVFSHVPDDFDKKD
ncbi:MAG: hypothetical protein J6M44_16005, partial [Butyrivibrio sp.]|nr:hypothetical protein [Butyrivibrio sp.]